MSRTSGSKNELRRRVAQLKSQIADLSRQDLSALERLVQLRAMLDELKKLRTAISQFDGHD
jgi:uncharacterized protein involved in exopolysaccharide biosynthesis